MDIEVSRFGENDIDTVFAIQRAAYESLYEKYHDDGTNPYTESKETVFRKYTREGTTGYLFAVDGIAVGAVRINIDDTNKTGRVSALCVLPKYQNKGIAQKALLEIERLHPDVERWFLDTILEEAGNCHLYAKIGYKKTEKTEVINEKMTLVFYEKK
ncbi:MAG: GNAT family N-acetyltransferase [Clostridia bacterium]|nr:GNAT family N-acetyltransferase [Clostridia bacterium]